MLILALDSSTSVSTAAVARAAEGVHQRAEASARGREILAEVSASTRGASEALLPAAHGSLTLAGVDLGEVEHILVGVGPGTFTGIRISLAATRFLSLATGAALSKGSTLSALAAPALLAAGGSEVLAVLDARRRQVFAQRFMADGARKEILCLRPEELSAKLPSESTSLVVGDGAVRYREVLSSLGRIPDGSSPLHRVTAAGHVLSADLSPVPAAEVVPLYLRKPDAEVRRDLNPWSRA
ncbi:MAG TPA: tRNA (adenosine(37)-N6)-threonylcarbamoyltransferase complex dimerization subunit type 1 TsaB [Rubrobacteraceae bacterium]|nr:tRNA (adenosine(37)-N6)-threonylcarbamoyltransferase complex dimerization subunit type 1 TsaB [Rubrobacteraceae bacterium]